MIGHSKDILDSQGNPIKRERRGIKGLATKTKASLLAGAALVAIITTLAANFQALFDMVFGDDVAPEIVNLTVNGDHKRATVRVSLVNQATKTVVFRLGRFDVEKTWDIAQRERQTGVVLTTAKYQIEFTPRERMECDFDWSLKPNASEAVEFTILPALRGDSFLGVALMRITLVYGASGRAISSERFLLMVGPHSGNVRHLDAERLSRQIEVLRHNVNVVAELDKYAELKRNPRLSGFVEGISKELDDVSNSIEALDDGQQDDTK